MKNHLLTLAGLALALSTINSPLAAFGQGSLTPPGPPAPMMKTLAQIEPRTPISSLPYGITNPGSYYLTTNLTSPGSGVGITIESGNVTLDLNGFTLQGVPGSTDGIWVSGTYTNVVIRNGTVTGWALHGIDAWSSGYPRNLLFEKLTVSANFGHGIYTEAGSIIRDCIAIGNSYSGFYSQGGEITGCVARENVDGFTVNNVSMLHCSAEFNGNYGFSLTSSRALDCDCLNNQAYGIVCSGYGNEIRRSRILFNNNHGIFFDSTTGANVIDDCEIANNFSAAVYTSGNGGAYIARNNVSYNHSGGILLNDSNNYVENNHILTTIGLNGIGISATGYTNNVVVRNVVMGGGSVGVNYNVFNTSGIGPIGSASSASSPWANISQ